MDYKIDRSMLESKSTEEIMRILKKERDDYTPEAIAVFEDILVQRGVAAGGPSAISAGTQSERFTSSMVSSGNPVIRNPSDAVKVLNDLLSGVLNGSVDPKVAEVSTNLVMAILRAMEQEFMTEAEED